MPIAVCSPVPVSPMVAPGLSGRPSGSPVMLSAPPTDRAILSEAGREPYRQPGQRLGARRAGLELGQVDHAHTRERWAGVAVARLHAGQCSAGASPGFVSKL